jgi:hypothetical protein
MEECISGISSPTFVGFIVYGMMGRFDLTMKIIIEMEGI